MKKRMIIVGIVTFVAACMAVIRLYGRKTMV